MNKKLLFFYFCEYNKKKKLNDSVMEDKCFEVMEEIKDEMLKNKNIIFQFLRSAPLAIPDPDKIQKIKTSGRSVKIPSMFKKNIEHILTKKQKEIYVKFEILNNSTFLESLKTESSIIYYELTDSVDNGIIVEND